MLESSPHSRSYICHDKNALLFPDFRLLRRLHTLGRYYILKHHHYSQKDVFGLVNTRFLAVPLLREQGNGMLHYSISRLWSLHTLIVHSDHELVGPVVFWNMHQLKYVEFMCAYGRQRLPPPPNSDNNIVVLENLHTLVGMVDFHLNEDVVRRIPNLRILDVRYGLKPNREAHCLSYLQRLSKLESFCCLVHEENGENLQSVCFPQSVKQICLLDVCLSPLIEWEDVLQKVGRLPFVEELLIQGGVFRTREWETIQGQFSRLKALKLISCTTLENWTVSEASHFPLLQNLILGSLKELEEIPSAIGEIATLQSIEVRFCSRSVVLSAKRIVEKQEELYGEDQLSFRVQVVCDGDAVLKSLATPNFQVEF